MAKRIYSKIDDEIFRHQAAGNWYYRKGKLEQSLETSDEKIAVKNKEYLKSSLSFFGAGAFAFKVADLYPIYLSEREKEVKRGDLRESTLRESKKIWSKHLLIFFGKKTLAQIDQNQWDKFTESVDVTDFQNHRNALTHFLKWCVRKNKLNAVRQFQNPKHVRRRRKIVEDAHLLLIFQHANEGLCLFLSFALFMGMRRSEIIKLKWSQIKESKLLLSDADVKTGEGREIPINSTVRALLDKRPSDSQWVFPSSKTARRHMDAGGFRKAWARCIKQAGLESEKYTWHDFRATYEKWMHKSNKFTDTQREKMVGASIDVQKSLYVSMKAVDLGELAEVVQVPGLIETIANKTAVPNEGTGKTRGKQNLTNLKKHSSDENDDAINS